MRSTVLAALTLSAATFAAGLAAPAATAGIVLDPAAVPSRTQITLRYSNGTVVSTANSHESRPALSLTKLYLGYWVLQHGSDADKARVENMIRFSEDATATDLDRAYPQAIPEVIAQFGLSETVYPGYWGNTTTSTEDITRFTAAIVNDPVAAPLVNGMRTAAPVTADGYKQDYGTSQIPGVIGTKFGWDDDRNAVNASVSIGDGYTIAANTYGNAGQLTADVLGAVRIVDDAVQSSGARVPSPFENQVMPYIPAQFQDQARASIRGTEDSINAARQQACDALAQAGSSRVC